MLEEPEDWYLCQSAKQLELQACCFVSDTLALSMIQSDRRIHINLDVQNWIGIESVSHISFVLEGCFCSSPFKPCYCEAFVPPQEWQFFVKCQLFKWLAINVKLKAISGFPHNVKIYL